MITTDDIPVLRENIRRRKARGERIAFVPTMGNLHEGHLTLVREARQRADCVICSIFVNPTQFGPSEDYETYPRTLEDDKRKLEREKTDIVFTPIVDTMYPDGTDLEVAVELHGLSDIHCGASRPGFFTGVATVVTKLLNIVEPDVALFGEKDYQQLVVIRQMVRALHQPTEMAGIPTVREDSGLAMSSRNAYLIDKEKTQAAALYSTLKTTADRLRGGIHDYLAAEEEAKEVLKSHGFEPDYFSICQADTLRPALTGDKKIVILAAATLGKARLIDNIQVNLP